VRLRQDAPRVLVEVIDIGCGIADHTGAGVFDCRTCAKVHPTKTWKFACSIIMVRWRTSKKRVDDSPVSILLGLAGAFGREALWGSGQGRSCQASRRSDTEAWQREPGAQTEVLHRTLEPRGGVSRPTDCSWTRGSSVSEIRVNPHQVPLSGCRYPQQATSGNSTRRS